jgi:hypothetical protein
MDDNIAVSQTHCIDAMQQQEWIRCAIVPPLRVRAVQGRSWCRAAALLTFGAGAGAWCSRRCSSLRRGHALEPSLVVVEVEMVRIVSGWKTHSGNLPHMSCSLSMAAHTWGSACSRGMTSIVSHSAPQTHAL